MRRPRWMGQASVESFFNGLQRFGIGRLTAILGAAGGVAAVMAMIILHVAAQPQALLIVNAALPGDASDEQVAEAVAGSAALLGLTIGVYGNFSEVTGEHVIEAMYPPATLTRLRAVKAEYDPHDVFRPAHHIAPA